MSNHARIRAGQRKFKDSEMVRALAGALDPSGTLVIITAYFPEPPKWVDEKTRGGK